MESGGWDLRLFRSEGGTSCCAATTRSAAHVSDRPRSCWHQCPVRNEFSACELVNRLAQRSEIGPTVRFGRGGAALAEELPLPGTRSSTR